MELALHNGKCAMCGNQLGPTTGHYSTFTSMEAVKQAYREQMFYWVKCMAKGVAFQLDCQSDRMPNPMTSCLLEGPIQSGRDVTSGGARETLMGVCMMGVANAGDALAAIDYLIYKKKILTWDTLMKALNANWEGYEDIREMCVNEAPKFGNDDDYADEFSAFVMHTWADALDWANTQKDLLPWFGGAYCAGTIVANAPVFHGTLTAALPDGHIARKPLADTLSPVQGHDVNGTTSVMKSEGKLPHHRMTNGTTINQRLNPQVLATDRDVDNFIQYLRTCNDLGTFLTQYNLISSEILKAAMETPEDYKDCSGQAIL